MATAQKKSKTIITLTLSEKEALWLRGFCQNYPGAIEDEGKEEQTNRHTIFTALTNNLD